MSTSERRTSRSFWSHAYQILREDLIRARHDAGLSQREAAALIRRSQSFVAKCESGERRLDVVELFVFANAYGRPISYFLDRLQLATTRKR